jgi:SAM-dependent methyltransferase
MASATGPSSGSAAGGYAFDNSGTEAFERLSAQARIFDPGTAHQLADIGVGPGWHCLEVGGGTGTVADWLCDRVGASGQVVVTDIDTRFLDRKGRPNLDVRRHDVVRDPLPEKAFDLVHTRLVLGHLPARDAVLPRLIAAVKPGGWLLAEEYDSFSLRPDPWINADETALKTSGAMQDVLARHGVDLHFGRRLPGRLRALGLAEVSSEGRLFMTQGGSVGADLLRMNFSQIAAEMIATGRIGKDELAQDLLQLQSPEFMAPSPIMWAVRGRRPG